MIKNYLKIAFRNLRRNKVYSIFNILGLAVGITGATLLYLYIDNELSYDTFHEKSDQIYRIVEIDKNDQGTRYYGDTAPILGTVLEETFPEIEKMVRVYKFSGHIDMEWKGERIHERNWLMTEPGFFEIFDFEFIHGSPKETFARPNSIVLTKRKAEQYFGDENPIGKVLPFFEQINESGMTITGVIENVPQNSHLQFDLLLSSQISGLDYWPEYLTDWEEYGAYTYLLLNETAHMSAFTSKLDTFVSNQQAVNENARDFYLQPISEIYFNSEDIEYSITTAHGNIFYIYLFSAIGIFLLLIAGINYMNLSTALSVQRGKEIGIRKAAGAEKNQLIGQFLSESIIIALLACICSYFLIELLMPFFNQLMGKHFSITLESFGYLAAVLLGIGLLLGIASGSYPAFYLAWIKPVRVLKSNADMKAGNIALRKILVVAQFSLSIILIISTLAIYKQISYIRSTDLGFDKEQMLVIDINTDDVRSRFRTMKLEIEKLPGVRDVAVSSRVPGEWKEIDQTFARLLNSGRTDSVQSYFMSFDKDMLNLYDLTLVSGRNFRSNNEMGSLKALLNQTAVEAFGINGNPVGQSLRLTGVSEPFQIIGVVEDFNFQSLHQKVAPLIIGSWPNEVGPIDYFSVRLTGDDIQGTIEELKQVHQQFDPETAMEYHFLDQQIEKLYEADVMAGRLFAIGGGVTIFIACLGLFGLALFSTRRRIKEIGIRKALGASIPQILTLLTTDFMKLVAIAFVVAVPVSWFVMQNWMQNFAYHTELGIWIFVFAGIGALVVSLLTVSWQSIRAALANPVDSLRSE